MVNDKYNAIWVSHSSIGDFLKCPRCYFLHNVYKDPKTGRKINIINPALSLGTAVHEVLERLANFKVEERKDKLTKDALLGALDKAWEKVSGKKGGFTSEKEELETKERARSMILHVEKNPPPLLQKTVKIKEGENGMPPNFFLSKEDNIILCGKIDWLIYNPTDDSIHILDFKTGRSEEKEGSLQLPIYQLLLKNLQNRKVSGASYWYLDRDTKPSEVTLPKEEESFEKVFSIAKQVKAARALALVEGPDEAFQCPREGDGCFDCRPFEKIIRGEAEYVGAGDMRQDLYIV